ncbi:hypothetical protein GCM10007096_25240 [Pullulanibacillus pueri]|uniref:Uncharacterized protein n=1 Tax=Pullulanibacillus pueri TaxID=1437324 RepID=A0A8J3EM56_9BACL|nr:hypothetical protein GCM10007096_25240 [Pullulanibacillus pueri]
MINNVADYQTSTIFLKSIDSIFISCYNDLVALKRDENGLKKVIDNTLIA